MADESEVRSETEHSTATLVVACPWCKTEIEVELAVHSYRYLNPIRQPGIPRTGISVMTPKRSYGGAHDCQGDPRE